MKPSTEQAVIRLPWPERRRFLVFLLDGDVEELRKELERELNRRIGPAPFLFHGRIVHPDRLPDNRGETILSLAAWYRNHYRSPIQ